jgi:glucosamine 6-phosphate synthetase-like amidotransferase/phosphosugar isomerase protein
MTMRAVERAHRSGMETVVVTGFPERVPVKGGHVLPTGYEDERSWAHTASYTAALTTFAAIANGLAEQSERLDLSPLPEVLREALELEGMAHSVAASAVVAERARGAPDVVLVGGGPNAVTASEGALKLGETSYTRAGSWELEEMLHGPLAAVDEGTLLLVIAPSGRSVERAAGLVRAARAIGAAPVAVVDEGNAGAFEDAHRLVMPEIPEVLSPIAYIVPVQLISYFLAVGKGINPDLIRRDDERYRRARSQYE